MRRFYSRLASVEEKRNIRNAFILIILTILALIIIFTFGLPSVAKFASFVGDLKKTSQPVDKNDTTPPAPPKINPQPEATNNPKISITGSTESGATVILSINGKENEVVADNNGSFNFDTNLQKGQNSIFAFARDKSGNESQKSPTVNIVFDNEPPNINISSPSDGQQFSGSKERQITIQGKTEAGSTLTINDRIVKVEDDGSFVFATTLNEGDNSFNLKSIDAAGNTTEKTLSVHFSL